MAIYFRNENLKISKAQKNFEYKNINYKIKGYFHIPAINEYIIKIVVIFRF